METRRTTQLASRPTRSAVQEDIPAVTDSETNATLGDLARALGLVNVILIAALAPLLRHDYDSISPGPVAIRGKG